MMSDKTPASKEKFYHIWMKYSKSWGGIPIIHGEGDIVKIITEARKEVLDEVGEWLDWLGQMISISMYSTETIEVDIVLRMIEDIEKKLKEKEVER